MIALFPQAGGTRQHGTTVTVAKVIQSLFCGSFPPRLAFTRRIARPVTVGRLPGERVHLWVVTHHPGSPQRWGGFDDLAADELAEVRWPCPGVMARV